MNEIILDIPWRVPPVIIYFFHTMLPKNRIILSLKLIKFYKVTFIETIVIISMTSNRQVLFRQKLYDIK